MKQIQELIKATQVLRVEGNSDTRVSRLAYDSRRIAPGDCFFAVSGTQSDGHAYIDAAVAAGAPAPMRCPLQAESSSVRPIRAIAASVRRCFIVQAPLAL